MDHFHYTRVDSTMGTARDILAQNPNCPLPFYVTTDDQTKGRGRYQRQWQPGQGNLYMTMVLPVNAMDHLPFYSYIASLSVLDCVKEILGNQASKATLKWPNDLLLEGKKASGVLLETDHNMKEHSSNTLLFIGIGMNITTSPQVPAYPTAKLSDVCTPPTAQDIAKMITRQFSLWEQRFLTDGFAPLRARWLAHRDPRHHHMRVTLRDQETIAQGTFHDLNLKGQLELMTVNKATGTSEIKTVNTGDVFFL